MRLLNTASAAVAVATIYSSVMLTQYRPGNVRYAYQPVRLRIAATVAVDSVLVAVSVVNVSDRMLFLDDYSVRKKVGTAFEISLTCRFIS